MARSFNGSPDFGTSTPGLSGASLVTICFWLWQNAFDSGDEMAMEYSVNANNNAGSFFIDPNSSSIVGKAEVFYCVAPISAGHDVGFTRPSAGAWHHWLVEINAGLSFTQVVAVYIDGISQSLTVRADNGASVSTFGSFPLYFMSRAGSSLFNAGRMADFALYNVLLTAGEASALGNGARPYTIRPSNLISYLPITGLQSPEPDFSGNVKNMTITGTTNASGPPTMPFTPRWHRYLGWTPMLPASGLGWIINRRNKLMVPKKRPKKRA